MNKIISVEEFSKGMVRDFNKATKNLSKKQKSHMFTVLFKGMMNSKIPKK